MRKAFKEKFSGTKKIVRRVLSKSSASISHESMSEGFEERMEQEKQLKNELGALKDQIDNLKAAIQTLQSESEQKDTSIANLARDKEKITLDLLKTRRSNTALAKQLEDERKFYFKEKEVYVHEMNECKKLKKFFSNSSIGQHERTIQELRNEVAKLRQTLNQTLEANYNLSIKFLRMKNTKTCLKTELQTMKLEHEKLTNEYKSKIEQLNLELSELVHENLTDSISPSSKKYLQLVKQNSCLVYENLCLQLEVDNLSFKLGKIHLNKTRSATNEHLTYIHHNNKPVVKKHKAFAVPIPNDTPEKLERELKPCCSKSCLEETRTLKIYESDESPGIPTIQIIHEKKHQDKKQKKMATQENRTKHESRTQIKQHMEYKNVKSQTVINSNMDVIHDSVIKIDDAYKEKIYQNSSKLSLFQVSNVTSSTSTSYLIAPNLKRSRSSPDIVQSTYFK